MLVKYCSAKKMMRGTTMAVYYREKCCRVDKNLRQNLTRFALFLSPFSGSEIIRNR